jgi:hypothetical protein
MAFIRTIKRDNPWSQIDRFVFESDPNLSWKAKGIMGYLLTRPDGWKIRFNDLVKRAKDGREAVTSGLKELEKEGYLNYYQERTEGGTFGEWIYDVYERPELNPTHIQNLPLSENPISVNPISGTALSEKTDYSNNNYNNNNFSNNNLNNNKFKILYSNISKVQADILRNLLRQYCFAEDEIENIIFNMDETNKIPKKEDLKFICEKMIDSNIELVAYNTIPLIHVLFETPKVTEIQTKAEPEPVVNKEVDQLLKKLFKNHIHESKRKVIHQLYKKYDGQISITDLQSILNGIGKKIHNNFDNFYYYLKTCFENYLQRENEVAATKEEEEITEEVSEEELLKLFKF